MTVLDLHTQLTTAQKYFPIANLLLHVWISHRFINSSSLGAEAALVLHRQPTIPISCLQTAASYLCNRGKKQQQPQTIWSWRTDFRGITMCLGIVLGQRNSVVQQNDISCLLPKSIACGARAEWETIQCLCSLQVPLWSLVLTVLDPHVSHPGLKEGGSL